MTCAKRMGMPQHFIVPACNLYSGQEATSRIEFEEKAWLPVGKGIRQRYILFPYLFKP